MVCACALSSVGFSCEIGRMVMPLILVILGTVFAGLFVLERFFSLRRRTRSLLQRLALNLTISTLAFVTAAALVKPAGTAALRWSAEKPFGLLHLFDLQPWASLALGFLLMDLSFYYWHLANHKVPLLWRFMI